jgi:hypothetical protein
MPPLAFFSRRGAIGGGVIVAAILRLAFSVGAFVALDVMPVAVASALLQMLLLAIMTMLLLLLIIMLLTLLLLASHASRRKLVGSGHWFITLGHRLLVAYSSPSCAGALENAIV